jgi:hypothetical protein
MAQRSHRAVAQRGTDLPAMVTFIKRGEERHGDSHGVETRDH